MNDFEHFHDIWIRESNLIEGIDDQTADKDSHEAFKTFCERKLSKDSILHLHFDVMAKQNRRIAGDFRRVNVRVGHYIAPEWKMAPNLMKDWLTHWSREKASEDILLAHILFERIHPFEDGNGRVGRMLMNYQRIKAGLDIACFYAVERFQKYYALFDEFDRRVGHDWTKTLRKRNGFQR